MTSILIISCSSPDTYLFATKDYWWGIYDQNNEISKSLKKMASLNNTDWDILPVDSRQNAYSLIKQQLVKSSYGTVICDPLISLQVKNLAEQFPLVTFVTINTPSDFNPLPNLKDISFDRSGGYLKAGRACAAYMMSAEFQNRILNAGIDGQNFKIGILMSKMIDQSENLTGAFKKGVLEANPAFTVIERDIPIKIDNIKIKKLIEEMKAEGVMVFLLGMLSLNSYCMERIEKMGALVITEDWKISGGFHNTVLLSIEENISEALVNVFSSQDILKGDRIIKEMEIYWNPTFFIPE